MRIAFFSFEFPNETGGGGIGTYLQQVVHLLRCRNHDVIVFTATSEPEAFWENEFTYRIPASGWKELNPRLPEYFRQQHTRIPFDVVEGTDFNACGVSIKKEFPQVPFVVRLHTPLYLIDRLQYRPLTFWQKLRFILGAWRRGQKAQLPRAPEKKNYAAEFELVSLANRVSSPSISIYREMQSLGFDVEGKTDIIPLPFHIPDALMSIKSRRHLTVDPRIVFIGRLEIRKGVVELARAIPHVLKKYPSAHFIFAGVSSISPEAGMNMKEYIEKIVAGHLGSITFTGKISHEQVYQSIDAGDVFVFPSHYESFGLACCEAMAAGKAVIAADTGGLKEIIEHEHSGLLVPPGDFHALASAIIRVLANNSLRVLLGNAARDRIINYLAPEKIIDEQMLCYQKAIEQKERP